VQHALTHFDWVLHPRRVVLDGGAPDLSEVPGVWVAGEQLSQYALPAPLKKLLD
jgi:A/G-specific adenine glycosylase